MEYTQDQLASLHHAKNRHHYAGRPQVSVMIDAMVENKKPFDEIWSYAQQDVEAMVKPEKPVDAIEPPPFNGAGSSTKAWQKFALAISDIEEEIVLSMGRTEIITVLSDRGVIQLPEKVFGFVGSEEEE